MLATTPYPMYWREEGQVIYNIIGNLGPYQTWDQWDARREADDKGLPMLNR